MNLNIRMDNIYGEYNVVYSKSTMHRALFAALLCNGVTKIVNITFCDDVIATLNVLKACNCAIKISENQVIIDSRNIEKPVLPINCNESASTLRMAIVICCVLFKEVEFIAHDTLIKRPIDGYGKLINIKKDNNQIKCSLNNITNTIEIDGSVSSQYITGLLLVSPVAKIKKITITKKIVSKGYIDITIDVLRQFGIEIDFNENILEITGEYKADNYYKNEIDESSMAFFKVLEALGANVLPSDMNIETSQPDKVIIDLIQNEQDVIDIDPFPDLLPILALYCCFKKEKTVITNTYRTTIKESNRLLNTMLQLNKLGANIKIENDEMVITPVEKFKENIVVDSCFDHRIEMMLAIATYKAHNLTIMNAGNNKKSFPEFYEFLLELGAIIEEKND